MPIASFIRFLVLGSVALFTLGGCSAMFGDEGVFRGKSRDYLKTGTVAPMAVPTDLQGGPIAPLYVVPSVAPLDEFGDPLSLGAYEVPRPAPINVEKGKVGVKLQSLGDNKWIFINASTGQVWPRTQNFLSQLGIRVAGSSPQRGIIDSADVVFNDAPDLKSRFRIVIDKGIHPETTEIHVIQVERSTQQAWPSDFRWPRKSDNLERERVLLNELANELAKSVNNNSASLLGQNVGGDLKVEFVKRDGEPAMHMRLQEERAQASVAHALGREGFVIWDENAVSGLFYVGFDEDYRENPGFFTRLFTREYPQTAPYPLATVLQNLAQGEEVKTAFAGIDGVAFNGGLPEAQGLLVRMRRDNEGVDLVLRDAQGRRLAPEQAKHLLRLIRNNLI